MLVISEVSPQALYPVPVVDLGMDQEGADYSVTMVSLIKARHGHVGYSCLQQERNAYNHVKLVIIVNVKIFFRKKNNHMHYIWIEPNYATNKEQIKFRASWVMSPNQRQEKDLRLAP